MSGGKVGMRERWRRSRMGWFEGENKKSEEQRWPRSVETESLERAESTEVKSWDVREIVPSFSCGEFFLWRVFFSVSCLFTIGSKG